MTNVSWVWSGAVTDKGVTVVARLNDEATSCRLVVSTTADFAAPAFSAPAAPDEHDFVRLSIDGLAPSTRYLYRVEIDSVVDTATTGEFRTFPPAGELRSFCFAFASCNYTDSNHRVFSQIAGKRPLFFLHLGDKHYADIDENDESLYRAALETGLGQERQAEFHRLLPVTYVWDNHDYGGVTDRTHVGRAAAAAVYRQMVPHYPLVEETGPIYHSFDVGKVRFLVTDLRYERDPNSDAQSPSKTMLGETQKAWFKNEIDRAVEDDVPLLIWANSQQWPIARGNSQLSADHWGSFDDERDELASYMAEAGCPPMIVVSGDAHMIAGKRNHKIAGMSFDILQSAALDQTGNNRDFTWEVGPSQGGGRYSILQVDVTGGAVGWRWWAFTVNGTSGAEAVALKLARATYETPVKSFDGNGAPITETIFAMSR